MIQLWPFATLCRISNLPQKYRRNKNVWIFERDYWPIFRRKYFILSSMCERNKISLTVFGTPIYGYDRSVLLSPYIFWMKMFSLELRKIRGVAYIHNNIFYYSSIIQLIYRFFFLLKSPSIHLRKSPLNNMFSVDGNYLLDIILGHLMSSGTLM